MDIQTVEPTNEMLHGIFITAIEGGGYGTDSYSIIKEYRWATNDEQGELIDDFDGFYAVIASNDETDKWETLRIDADVIKRGIELIAQGKAGEVCPNARLIAVYAITGQDPEEVGYDTVDADQVVQVGLFGEVIYG